MAQVHAFSLNESPTTTPLRFRSHASPTKGIECIETPTTTTTQFLSEANPSTIPTPGIHPRPHQYKTNNALPAHVRSYVQELRRKRKEFDTQRYNLKHPQQTTTTNVLPLRTTIHTASVPVPVSSSSRRALAQSRTTERTNSTPSAHNIMDQLKEATQSLNDKINTISQLEIMLNERDRTTLKLQLRIHELETNHSALQRQTSNFLKEKEMNITRLHQQMNEKIRDGRKSDEEYELLIQHLQHRNDVLKVELLALKTSPLGAIDPNSWMRTREDIVRSNNVIHSQDDQTELIVQLKLAVEALELRNYELKTDLVACQNQKNQNQNQINEE